MFNKTVNEAESSDTSSWTSPSNLQNKPRWNIKTPKEQKEQDNLIRVLETKMLKARQKGYTSEQILRSAVETSYSDQESDSSDNEGRIEEEEGLSLLWKSKADNLEEAIKQSKKEHEYTSWFPRWLSCCCCL
ncbi:hypothetical protein K501DRAFT_282562 [Backusella circina FSU 941]|nr:hypothetical protein K501DRAFT_282562 [Backusella circina FSU 941]